MTVAELIITRLGCGDELIKWNGDRYELIGREQGLGAYTADGAPIGFIFWEPYDPASDFHPNTDRTRPYLFLHSAWTSPEHRGRGVFTMLADQLNDLHPGVPVDGMAMDGDESIVGRFLARSTTAR